MSPKCARCSTCGVLNVIVATKRLPPADVYMPASVAMDLHVT
jgi:acetamidase/formamidase